MQLKGEIAALAAAMLLGGCAFGFAGGLAACDIRLGSPDVGKSKAAGRCSCHQSACRRQNHRYRRNPRQGRERAGRLLFRRSLGRSAATPFPSQACRGFREFRRFQCDPDEPGSRSGDVSLAIEIRDFQVETSAAGAEAVVDVYVETHRREKQRRRHDQAFSGSFARRRQRPVSRVHALNGAFPRGRARDRILGFAAHFLIPSQ